MAKPTEKQIREFEAAHKRQFSDLVATTGLYHAAVEALYKKYFPKSPPESEKQKLLSYAKNSLIPLAVKWMARQDKLDQAGQKIFPEKIKAGDWFNKKNFTKLQGYVAQLDAEKRATSGIGFIPLLIWGIIAIVGFFTAEEVVDELNNTSEEQAELVQSTNKFCKENNLTPEMCKQLLQQQTEASSGGTGSFLKIAGIALAAVLGFRFLNQQQSKKAA